MSKSPDAFRTISEVADWLGVQAHVLRFWESRFSQVKPVKRAGGRRYYRPNDMQLLGGIKRLLHDDGLTIKGVQRILREEGVAHVARLSQSLDEPAVQQASAKGNVIPFMEHADTRPTATQMDMDLGDPPAPRPPLGSNASTGLAGEFKTEDDTPKVAVHSEIESDGTESGVLAKLWSIDRFDKKKLVLIAPLARDLRAWLDKVDNQAAG